jgi:hypothetical protein
MNAILLMGLGLRGACRLAVGRVDAVRDFGSDRASARLSFWAIAFALPLAISILGAGWVANGAVPPHWLRLMAREALVFVASWLAFAALSWRMAARSGRGPLWPGYIVAWNWCNVVGNMLLTAAAFVAASGAHRMAGQVAELTALGWALWLEWYATRLTLRAGPLLAAYFVAVDQLIGISFSICAASLGPR